MHVVARRPDTSTTCMRTVTVSPPHVSDSQSEFSAESSVLRERYWFFGRATFEEPASVRYQNVALTKNEG